jgi:UDP-3-O-[3-hydroxymyristoyl] N-acetylglucosamine deacetylase
MLRPALNVHPTNTGYMGCQTTIDRAVECEGIGLHTAVPSRLRLVPAPADTGIVFRRVDLENFEIEAHARHLARVSYATSLMKKGVLLSTTEHLLAALYACGIDNVYAEIDALEVPILDGSSEPFIALLEQAGLRRLRRRRRYLRIRKPLEISEGDRRIGIYPADEFRIRCFIDFAHPMVGREEIEMPVNRETFSRFLAPARTFGFLDEVDRLRAVGLIRGGSLDNAIVLTKDGLMNDGGLRFPDEFGRHKALDLIGDLALVGRPLKALVVAHKAGHALHTQLVTRLLADRSLWMETTQEAARRPAAAGSAASELPEALAAS